MKPKKTRSSAAARPEVRSLENHYRKIGISAVAAAMRYQSDAKTDAASAQEGGAESVTEMAA